MGPDGIIQVLLRERVRLTAVAAAVLRDVNAADDAFQQVVLMVLEARIELADARHALAWGLRTVRHRAVDMARRNHLRPISDEVLDALEARWANPDGCGRPEQVDALSRCVGKLAESARALLHMRYQEGLTGGEIAGRLQRSEEAVYQSLYRIHKALRGCVGEELSARTARTEAVT